MKRTYQDTRAHDRPAQRKSQTYQDGWVRLKLKKAIKRNILAGQAWVFADALGSLPTCPPGSPALLLDATGDPLAWGYAEPEKAIAFRVLKLALNEGFAQPSGKSELHEFILNRLEFAWTRRSTWFGASPEKTDSYRICNGEGDRLPGLVVDKLGRAVVLQTDGEGAENFYPLAILAGFLAKKTAADAILYRTKSGKASILSGNLQETTEIKENGMTFLADLLHGQKTGFFLDQRENRALVASMNRPGKVLNLFGYTGGFSVAAGLAGAEKVVTVDQSRDALAAAEANWLANSLPENTHQTVHSDVKKYLPSQAGKGWNFIICDPPSFAPNEASLPSAIAAYRNLARQCASALAEAGTLLLCSCSSHVTYDAFLKANAEGFQEAGRQASIIHAGGQGIDHPWPAAMPELRYLKAIAYALD